MLRKSWKENRSSESFLERIVKQRELLRTIRKRKLSFLDHVLWREAFENISSRTRLSGSRPRGKPKIKYTDSIKKINSHGLSAGEILQMTRNRHEWKSMIANVICDTARCTMRQNRDKVAKIQYLRKYTSDFSKSYTSYLLLF